MNIFNTLVTFPTAFPNNVFSITTSPIYSVAVTAGNDIAAFIGNVTKSNFYSYGAAISSTQWANAYWMAIGN